MFIWRCCGCHYVLCCLLLLCLMCVVVVVVAVARVVVCVLFCFVVYECVVAVGV